MEIAGEDAAEGYGEDFSSNAITDGLEKYSRFHSKNEFSVWCNSPNTRLTDAMRELVYQINPNNITCVYKKMFETCALNNLRILEFGAEDEYGSRSPSPTKSLCGTGLTKSGNTSEPTTPRQAEPLPVPVPVNKSNSCVYGSASEPLNGTKKTSSKEFSGWKICVRPHSAICTGYQKLILEESREKNKSQGKSSCYRTVSPRPFPNSLRSLQQRSARLSTKCGFDLSKSGKSSRERLDDCRSVSSTPGSAHKSPIKVGKHFKHFRRHTSYMDQYRDEYTYKKLRDFNRPASVDSMLCRCGSPNCSASLSAASLPNWYPIQSHFIQPMNIPHDMTLKSTLTPMRSPVFKKRLQVPPYVKQLVQTACSPQPDAKKFDTSGTIWKKDGTKLEFFSNSLTVNSYNPTVKPSNSIGRLPTPGQGRGRQLSTPIRNSEKTYQGSPDVTLEKFYYDQNMKGT